MRIDLTIGIFTLAVIFLSLLPIEKTYAQNVTEPPIPIYVFNSHQKDSIKASHEKMLLSNSLLLANTQKRCDSLERQIQTLSAEDSTYFIWLYIFIGILLLINIVLFISTSNMKKKLEQVQKGHK
jgi:hypothetical protein